MAILKASAYLAKTMFYEARTSMRHTRAGSLSFALVLLVLAFSSKALADASFPNTASDDLTQKIDNVFATCNKPNSPGCAVAVIKEGKIIYEHGYGLANLEYNIPI